LLWKHYREAMSRRSHKDTSDELLPINEVPRAESLKGKCHASNTYVSHVFPFSSPSPHGFDKILNWFRHGWNEDMDRLEASTASLATAGSTTFDSASESISENIPGAAISSHNSDEESRPSTRMSNDSWSMLSSDEEEPESQAAPAPTSPAARSIGSPGSNASFESLPSMVNTADTETENVSPTADSDSFVLVDPEEE
jgi:hypothetical protein